jgi:CheY-like chemotaxis protein
LTNAIKYSPRKSKVTVSHGAAKSGSIRVRVIDNGPGIPKEKLSRLFTPFDRLGAEQSTVEGTGLGLALCQRLMKAMQGSIGVNSSVGKGSTFWVELPRAASPLERVLSGKRNGSESKEFASTDKRKILYVEDNLSNVTLIEHMLREQPEIQLITAMQGQLALDLARKHSPDVILLDLHLPDLPGWDVLSQLQREETTRHIPVVIISADATSGQIERLMAAGAHAYLTKPIQIPEFFEIIEKATKQKNGATQCAVAQTGDRAAAEIEATRAR